MARRFTVSFDLEFTEDIEPGLVTSVIEGMLDDEEFDHSDVDVFETPEEDEE